MAQEQSSDYAKPDEKTLREAGELEVLDGGGKAIPFNQLYNTENRQVIVFVRHFFCGVSVDTAMRTYACLLLTTVTS